jgi:hypothetical protein
MLKNAVAMLKVLFVLAPKAAAIGPAKGTFTPDEVLLPLALVLSPVRPLVKTFTVQLVVHKHACIERSVSPFENAAALLFAHLVLPLERGAVWPLLASLSVLQVLFPQSLVLCLGLRRVNAKPFSLAFDPLSVVNTTIRSDQAPASFRLVMNKDAFKPATVLKNEKALTVALFATREPLPLIDGPIAVKDFHNFIAGRINKRHNRRVVLKGAEFL